MDGTAQDFERWRARGDLDALTRVFDAQAPGLLRFAVHLVGDANAAEDLVQETFLTALRSAGDYDAARPIDRWLAGILVHRAQELRREARRFPSQAVPETWDLDTPLETASRREMSAELARAIDALEEPYRAPMLMHLHGLEPAVIAHVLGRSPGAVRVQLHRAREMLRKSLPAGIASALVMLAEPARGLECARNQVLEHAAWLAPAAGTGGALLGGVLAMKKFLVAAAIVLVLLIVVWWSARPGDLAADGDAAVVSAHVTVEREDLVARNEPLLPGLNAERALVAPVETVAAIALQPFRCRVVDGLSGLPVVGARLAYFLPKPGRYSEVRARWPERFRMDSWGSARAHDWPWFRTGPTARQRLDVDPILSYEGPLPGERPVATATSGANGEAVVDLPADQAFVVVEHASYATREMPPVLERTANWHDGTQMRRETFRDQELVVKLFRTQILRGQLIDFEGHPLAERIDLRLEGEADGDVLANGWHSSVPTGSWNVRTNGDGSFEAEVAAPRVRVECLDPGWFFTPNGVHPERKGPWRFVNVYDVDTADLAWVPLRRNPVVVVRSAADDAPVRDYRVLVVDLETRWPRGLLTRIRSDDGRARLLGTNDLQMQPGASKPVAVHVLADGFAPGLVECAEPDKASEIVVRLQPGACPRVEGRVLDGGRPVAGASILIAPSDRWNWSCDDESAGAATETDADGRFAICAPPGGWVVNVAHGGRSQCRFVEHPGAAPIAIDLARDTVVEFAVEGEPGASFEGVWAHLSSGMEVGQALQLDAQGRARFGSLPAGRYTARVRGDGIEFAAARGDDEFDVVAGATRTLRFARSSGDGPRLARLVVDGLASLTGWKARSVSLNAPWLDVESDGRVPIDVGYKPSGLLIQDPEGRTYQFEVPFEMAGEPVLRVALGRGGYGGVLHRHDGRPQTARRIVASFPPDENGLRRVECAVDREGRFRLDALPTGARTLTITDARGNAEFDGFELVEFACSAGPAAPGPELAIELPRGRGADGSADGRIALRGVAREAGEPARGRGLSIQALRDMPGGTLAIIASTAVLSDGSYVLATVPAPRHLATCWLDAGRPRWEQEFTLPLDVAEARMDFAIR